MRAQNDKMKAELKLLTEKLEEFVEKTRGRKNGQFPIGTGKNELDKDEEIITKELELKQSQHKVSYYKREIENMRRQLEGSYNITKIIALEDEQKNKERILKQLQDEAESLLLVQHEQEKALKALNKEGEYDSKIYELGEELRQAKETLRRLQFKQREDEKLMKSQHEQLVLLDEKCRKIRSNLMNKKPTKLVRLTEEQKMYTQEDLVRLQQQLKDVEQEKLQEEKKGRAQVHAQEQVLMQQQQTLRDIETKTKEKEQEYRLNELKIKELKRQLPQKPLKPGLMRPLGSSHSAAALEADLAQVAKSQNQSVQQLPSRQKLPPAFPKTKPPKQTGISPKAQESELNDY